MVFVVSFLTESTAMDENSFKTLNPLDLVPVKTEFSRVRLHAVNICIVPEVRLPSTLALAT
jgi:hypothetical protein